MKDTLVLYARSRGVVHLLSIRHQRQRRNYLAAPSP